MSDSREKIINAAIEVFAQKGKHGTRMEEIAAVAGVNKAMVYYYFSSRENLFKEVIIEIQRNQFTLIADRVEFIMTNFQSPKDRLVESIKAHFEIFSRNLNHAKLLLYSLVNNPEYIHQAMETLLKEKHSLIHKSMETIITDGIHSKIFREVDPLQTQISIMGINMVYFIGMSIGQAMLDCPCGDETKFMENRIDSVIDLILNGILANPTDK
jgi:TetR/AcrR family transcriptional regulator